MLEHVFQPGRLGTLVLPHRIVMGSMHLGFESEREGEALGAFYAERVRAGVGLVITGGSAVSRVGAGGRNYTFINEEVHSPVFSNVVRAVHQVGGLIALQLFHAGRYASEAAFGLQPLAPSAVPSRFSNTPPFAMSIEQISQTISDFAAGATRARELGFDGIELMGSEGYLLNQFVSPLTNRREDEWGGSALQRMRFPRAVVRAIRTAVGSDFPLIFRLSADDLMPGSTRAEDTAHLARLLIEDGVDAIDLGIGWHESSVPTVQYTVPPGAWVDHGECLKQVLGAAPIIAGTRIPTLELAEQVLAHGQADFVSLARPLLADPALIAKSRRGESERINICIACNQACIDRSLRDQAVSCMVNPRAGRELEWPLIPAPGRGERFAVVGGGPAGLEAARVLAALGHEVVLYEAQAALGGQFRLACRIPGKAAFARTILYFEGELRHLGVEICLGRPMAGASALDELLTYRGVIVATGVRPRAIELSCAPGARVRSYAAELLEETDGGESVAIIGAGGIGVDVAHRLSTAGHEVTLMCRGGVVGRHIGRSTRWVVLRALREQGVRIMTGVSYQSVESDGVWVRDREGLRGFVSARRVVIAAGQEPNDELSKDLCRRGCLCRTVGGARDAGEVDAVRAFYEGAQAARELVACAASDRSIAHPVTAEQER